MTSDAELALRHINREWSERLKQMPLLTETIDNLDLIYQVNKKGHTDHGHSLHE